MSITRRSWVHALLLVTGLAGVQSASAQAFPGWESSSRRSADYCFAQGNLPTKFWYAPATDDLSSVLVEAGFYFTDSMNAGAPRCQFTWFDGPHAIPTL